MKIYEFMYCPCIHDSDYIVMSTHRTKKGAYQAMKKFLFDYFEMERQSNWDCGNRGNWKIGQIDNWIIVEGELLD